MKIRAKKKNILKEIREKRSPSAWVPPGQEVIVGHHRIADGMIYVGREMKAAQAEGREPALIDPSLPRAPKPEGRADWMLLGLPTYDRLSPAQRTAYLDWLAGGRCAAEMPDFCPLLFFLGIERRVLHDAQKSRVSDTELLRLIAETERLLHLYRDPSIFTLRAGSFVVMARMILQDYRPESLESVLGFLDDSALRELGPALFHAAGRPLSPAWALALWRRWSGARSRRALSVCPDKVRDLFALRYQALPGGGFRPHQVGPPVVVRYLPLNPGLPRLLHLALHEFQECHAPLEHLQQVQRLIDETCAELAPYCRWITKTGDRESAAAVALLPPELARRVDTEDARRLLQWVEETLAGRASAPVRCEEATRHWPVDTAGRFTRRPLDAFAAFLERSGYGVVPDPRSGDSLPREQLVLFRLPGGEAAGSGGMSPAGEAAAVVLQLAVAVALADGAVDPGQERHLLEHVEDAAHLDPAERARLQACLRWFLAEPQGLLGAEKRLRSFAEERCQAVARFLIAVAGADGHVSPEEIRLLSRIYRVLRLDPGGLYADIHAVLAGAEPAAAGSGLALDRRKIEDKLAETVQASALLGEIFGEEEPPSPAPPQPGGLDATHAALLRKLAARASWERTDFEEHAAALGLLPDGALEMLNEAAFHLVGEPLLEGDETLEVDPQVLREMLP